MDKKQNHYDGLIESIRRWAVNASDVQAVVIIGSRARAARPADEFSDLDLLVVATDIDRFYQTTDWLQAIGTPWLWFDEQTPAGMMERRVLFDQALDVDFVLMSLSDLQNSTNDLALSTLQRGYRVLVDKVGISHDLKPVHAAGTKAVKPTESEFVNDVNDFWFHTVWLTKKLLRGEVWMAKSCLDGYLKRILLRMAEHQAHIKNGWDYDTWFDGRFFDNWADPVVVKGIRYAYAHYDEDDIIRALRATMELFRTMAAETAVGMGWPYPQQADREATRWVDQALQLYQVQ
ncbi:MAG: aminoglycoside 6-adenylyltransferase [Eubacteriales bacterium]|nr:aminoglycoside 6-adenylyltransferase [Eubacteriales bacterium]MDD3866620.1 aminoglycoside 6-adenylyltransferase [Eubacteriales bacterium]MDD4461088.1 aminoglycoside 6-adenylyltransferase [Eubacteriales bacterium]